MGISNSTKQLVCAKVNRLLSMPWYCLLFCPWWWVLLQCGMRAGMGICSSWRRRQHRISLVQEIPLMRSMTLSFSNSLHTCSYRAILGQSTIEAAVLIPSVMVLIALLVQPACLLYTQMLMRGAAAETARAVLTARNDSDLSACKDFSLRRLAAVPEVSFFHVGGQGDWQVKTSDGEGGCVRVSITGHARPLPLFGSLASAFYERDGTGLVLQVDMIERMRPEWLGGAYADWVSVWK